jgi:uncharacterized membrane protein YqjE
MPATLLLALTTSDIYLLSTHITRNKIIAGVAILAVLVAAAVVWLVMRSRRRNA